MKEENSLAKWRNVANIEENRNITAKSVSAAQRIENNQ
jgi:hypothetical protein